MFWGKKHTGKVNSRKMGCSGFRISREPAAGGSSGHNADRTARCLQRINDNNSGLLDNQPGSSVFQLETIGRYSSTLI
jgi:hypothetical protein